MFEPYYALLPPHWVFNEETRTYYNEITGEDTAEHPITIFFSARNALLNPSASDPVGIEIERIQYEVQRSHGSSIVIIHEEGEAEDEVEVGKDRETAQQQDLEPEESSKEEAGKLERISGLDLPSGKYYEYHCQWSERDLFGKVSLYGLTFRYYEESHKTLIRFDGLVGEWVYSILQGPYGPLELIDFFIGAKIKVFGRTVTISSASGSAVRWIEAQRKNLEKQQERFREKIMAVGQVPCVKPKDKGVVRNITRGAGTEPGHTDLRKLLQQNAKLGEQLVSLGLCDQL